MIMKTLHKIAVVFNLPLFILAGCTKDFEEINTNPNRPIDVPSYAFMTSAQKQLCDNIFDEWWGGRQSMLWAQ